VDPSAGRQGLVLRVEMDIGTGVELECSYGAGDGRTRSRVASMPKERSGGPRLDRSCNWEKYGYDILHLSWSPGNVVGETKLLSSNSLSSSLLQVFSTANISVTSDPNQYVFHLNAKQCKLFPPMNGKLHVNTSMKLGNQ